MTTYFQAPENPNDTTEYRRILADLRAMDAANDDEPDPRRAHSERPRHRALAEQFAPLMEWRHMREATESEPVGSTWMMAAGDPAAPTNAEPGKQNLFSEEELILAASLGVRWKLVGGRLVPADGSLKYDARGRLVQCGALVIAGEIDGANDNEPKPKQNDADKVEIFVGGVKRQTEPDDEEDEDSEGDLVDWLNDATDIDRGRRDDDKIRVGEIVGILHKTRHEGVKMRKAPRNPDGRFRPRKGKRPPPSYTIAPDDRIDSTHMLARLLALLSADAVMVLDYALRASNFEDIGMLFGKSDRQARRVGKQRLLDSCAEFEAAMQKIEEQDSQRLAA